MTNSWRNAYFKQALADYEMFLLLERTANIPGLAPDLAGTGPNPEYPWEIPQGILVPIEFTFPDIDLNANVNAKLRNLLKFIDICFDIAKRELGDA